MKDDLDEEDVYALKRHVDFVMEYYESMRLLHAVDCLDKIRSVIEPEKFNHPPEIRKDLMKLHEMVMQISGYGRGDVEHMKKVRDLAWNIEGQMEDVATATECILKVLRPLTEDPPENEDDWADASLDDDEEVW